MSRCKHLLDTEAWMVGQGGKETPQVGHLCGWADANPDRFIDAPRWITSRAIASELIRPERHCVGCPGYAAKESSNGIA